MLTADIEINNKNYSEWEEDITTEMSTVRAQQDQEPEQLLNTQVNRTRCLAITKRSIKVWIRRTGAL